MSDNSEWEDMRDSLEAELAAAEEKTKRLREVLELAKATIERLHRHAPGSAVGTLDVISKTLKETE